MIGKGRKGKRESVGFQFGSQRREARRGIGAAMSNGDYKTADIEKPFGTRVKIVKHANHTIISTFE